MSVEPCFGWTQCRSADGAEHHEPKRQTDPRAGGWLVSAEEAASTPPARQFDEGIVVCCQSVGGICSLIISQVVVATRHPMSEFGHDDVVDTDDLIDVDDLLPDGVAWLPVQARCRDRSSTLVSMMIL